MKSSCSLFGALRFASPVAGPLSFTFLFFLSLPVLAQDDPFITVSAPLSSKAFSQQESDVFTTVSTSAIRPTLSNQPATVMKAVAKPADQPISPAEQPVAEVASVIPAKEPVRELEQELLRDPFWPVGFFPEGWQKKKTVMGSPNVDSSGWNMAAGKIKISGTSQMGGRTVAIVNGDLKSTGDQIEVISEGKTYQWQIIRIEADGRVQLKKLGIK
jgi:hypothetical protein